MKIRPCDLIAVLLVAASIQTAAAQPAKCPPKEHVVYIRQVAGSEMEMLITNLIDALKTPNTTVLLASDVAINFSSRGDGESAIIRFGHCVTLASYVPDDGPVSIPRTAGRPDHGLVGTDITTAAVGAIGPLGPGGDPGVPSARTPHTTGPLLQYGENDKRTDGATFIAIDCTVGPSDLTTYGDGARISGFRLWTKHFEDHHTVETGLNIAGCHDVEISNMEIAGWGGAAIEVKEANGHLDIPKEDPPEILVLIHDNYIHHNQHSTESHGARGYGVEVGDAAFAKIFQNVFDYNRHSITASGFAGGYQAERNLILKGGGYHGSFFERDIHVFDVHGTANCPALWNPLGGWDWLLGGGLGGPFGALLGGLYNWLADASQHVFNCGDAGRTFLFRENAFQYKKTNDIKIRGQPTNVALIDRNVFARSDKDAAIALYADCCTVQIKGNNQYDVDTFGQYAVCDIDGDGVDDLFLATGVTWWFSSAGKFPWTFLRRDDNALKDLRFGYFDGDLRCDVLRQTVTGFWFISSGGVSDWAQFGDGDWMPGRSFDLSEVYFGRFDPSVRDHRPGVTRQTTHAFWRRDDGQWFVTSLSRREWKAVASSSFPMSELRFGDFTGDSVTDVLAVENGHWAISDSANSQWQTLNQTLSDPVRDPNIFIANMDAGDNIDDILRLDREVISGGQQGVPTGAELTKLTWQRSKNGTDTTWALWKSYQNDPFMYPLNNPDYVPPSFGFAGRFGAAPGAGTMVIDASRIGHFFSPAQGAQGAEWLSLFPY